MFGKSPFSSSNTSAFGGKFFYFRFPRFHLSKEASYRYLFRKKVKKPVFVVVPIEIKLSYISSLLFLNSVFLVSKMFLYKNSFSFFVFTTVTFFIIASSSLFGSSANRPTTGFGTQTTAQSTSLFGQKSIFGSPGQSTSLFGLVDFIGMRRKKS